MWEKVLPSTIAEHLSANIFTDGGGAIQLEQHVGLQQVLGAVNLNTSHVVSRGVYSAWEGVIRNMRERKK